MIAIIDYGMGNIHSVQKAIQLCRAQTRVTDKPLDIAKAKAIVLPGVGAFDDAMLQLQKKGLVKAITEHIKNKKPFLGICLGMQVLFEKSEEASRSEGLKIIKGKVRKLQAKKGLKVPHMGWNQLKKISAGCPLFKGIADNAYVYFCHSYYPEPSNAKVKAATTDYGKDFTCVVEQNNVYGVQFHPEKSQSVGLKILKNFVNLI